MMDISFSLYGMRGMDSQHGPVRDMLHALKRQLDRSVIERKENITNAYLSKALMGLNRMKDDSDIVCELLSSLERCYVNAARTSFSASEFGMCLYGLRSMSPKTPEVMRLLTKIAEYMPSAKSQFTPFQIAQALEGLRNCSGDSDVVKQLAVRMAFIVDNSDAGQSISHVDVTSCVHGLRALCASPITPEATSLIVSLTAFLEKNEFILNWHDLKQCQYFVSAGPSDCRELQELVELLSSRLPNRSTST